MLSIISGKSNGFWLSVSSVVRNLQICWQLFKFFDRNYNSAREDFVDLDGLDKSRLDFSKFDKNISIFSGFFNVA